MNGVEVLSEKVIYEVAYFEPLIAILLISGVILGLIFGYIASHKNFDVAFMCGMFGFFVGGFFLLFTYPLTAHTTDAVNYIEYKVTVSDEVDFNEFNDKYEILDQEGKIFTVKERSKVEE